MSKLSLFDKLKVLVDVTSSSSLFVIALLLLVSLAYLFVTTNKKNAKSSKFTYSFIYLIIIIITTVLYKDSLSKMFDYMMNNFFIAIYFPNLAIYFAAIIISNIILWISIFNFKISKIIKYINTVIYCIIHYLLILIINIITTNKLDVFTQSSVYQNDQALALIELSSSIFVIWILLLGIYKLIRIYQTRKMHQEEPTTIVEKTPKKTLPINVIEVDYPKYVVDTKKDKVKEEQKKQDELTYFENMLTLEDYKLVLSILKNQKEEIKHEAKYEQISLELSKPVKETNTIDLNIESEKLQPQQTIIEEQQKLQEKKLDEELEKYLEQERLKLEKEEQRKMTDLERLYSSIR